MEAEKAVNWTANALTLLADLYEFIESQSGDEFASNYVDDLLAFGNGLSTKSLHFSYCRNTKLQAKGYRCAVFRHTYILIYNQSETEVFILAVIHVKRGPDIFEQV
ncbi:MAG: type II toxin-antitoxin system RelE/ParE family toxin [Lewinellaceae bacterium]|nr:type II toxin-antitoxin system RelE/ParE family toxin [Saprospiraceae bacterium]MCB9317098.1 type II toxin-antitoxin system RelE/ParE family toxin [Lewinellaceae bacterium]MCB9333787.1 type II toxin-antitoxin system RelE/ParE family toxin [Lewinellaceae bacterium]